jgi:hypothetical protein
MQKDINQILLNEKKETKLKNYVDLGNLLYLNLDEISKEKIEFL